MWHPLFKTLHWLTAILIISAAIVGIVLDEMALSPAKLQLFVTHKSVGITILALLLLRVVLKAAMRSPGPVERLDGSANRRASLGHVALYTVAIAMPLSGWLLTSAADFPFQWFGLFAVPMIWPADAAVQELASAMHGALFIVLAVLVFGHIGMALWHHRKGVPVLARMFPGSASPGWFVPAIFGAAALAAYWAWSSVQPLATQALPSADTVDNAAPLSVSAPDTGQALDANWLPGPDKTLGFVGTYAGVPFEGAFEQFTARIRFSPDDLSSARFDVDIDTASAATGSSDMDGMLPDADWFYVALHPVARYRAERFSQAGEGLYVAHGTLSLKGVEQAVDLQFAWTPAEGDTAILEGEASVNRTDFLIGDGIWREDDTIGFEVQVVTRLLLSPVEP